MDELSFQDLDSRLTVLLQPDELASYDYRKTVQRSTPLEPERRLMLAILEDAIFCFRKYVNPKSRKERKLYQEAIAWIFDPIDDWIFSFEEICQACGFDPDYLRAGLLHWRKQRTAFKAAGRMVSYFRRHRPGLVIRP